MYDPTTNQWDDAAMADLPPGVELGPGADFVLDGQLVCAGGVPANDLLGTPSAAVWMYDPASDSWQHTVTMHEARFRLEGDRLGGVGTSSGAGRHPGSM